MNHHEKHNYNDLRIKKTEKAIRKAFLELIKEKNINKITIRELSERAEINKTTFYAHYESIQDLIANLQQEGIDYIVSTLDNLQMLFKDSDLFISNLYQSLYGCQIPSIAHLSSNDGQFSDKVSTAIQVEMNRLNIDISQYHQLGSLIGFIFSGILSLSTDHSETRLEDLEYIKTFIRGGIKELHLNCENL